MKILAFGETLWDVYTDNAYIGGAPFNFAAHLAKHKEDVSILTAFGDDEFGNRAIYLLKQMGISSDLVTVLKDKETGKCIVSLDENSIPSYNLLDNVAYDYINCDGDFADFNLLYFGTLALRSKKNLISLRKMLDKNSFEDIFVDVNIRKPHYSKETVEFAAENATIIKISDEELNVVADLLQIDAIDTLTFAEGLSENYPKIKYIIITLGEKGACVYDALNRKMHNCTAVKVDVVSTVGAGDSFSAAFVYKLFTGANLDECLRYATRVAAFVVSKLDAVPDYNTNEI